jgi:hypothetical protein
LSGDLGFQGDGLLSAQELHQCRRWGPHKEEADPPHQTRRGRASLLQTFPPALIYSMTLSTKETCYFRQFKILPLLKKDSFTLPFTLV